MEVWVSADDEIHAGLGEQLGTNDVDDALVSVTQGMQTHAKLLGVLARRLNLKCGS